MLPPLPPPGTAVHCAMTKWGERPHWEMDGLVLGADEHGAWVGFPAGTHHARPGLAFDSEVDSVSLYPHDAGFVATHHRPGTWCDLYVDITSSAAWTDVAGRPQVGAVDLDLDVIRLTPGSTTPSGWAPPDGDRVMVDDEDEFAEHRVAYGYPDDVVRAAEASCADVVARTRAGAPPFDAATAAPWFAVLDRLLGRESS